MGGSLTPGNDTLLILDNADVLEILEDHVHKAGLVYPTLDDPITLTAGGTAWASFPTPTEIVPASTIGDEFDIHWVNVSAISANGDYEIALYSGAALAEVEIARFAFVRNAVQSQEGSNPCQTQRVAANARISAALSSGNAAADTCKVKIEYHTY